MMRRLVLTGALAGVVVCVGAAPSVAVANPAPAQAATSDPQRDLRADSYYNKPGATRADYDRDWLKCRLIARGSPVAGTMAMGVVGAMLDYAIEEGRERRANRASCMIFNGWRIVVPTDVDRAKLAAMSDTDRMTQLNVLLGAPDTLYKSMLNFRNAEADAYSLKMPNRVVTPGDPVVPTPDLPHLPAVAADRGVVLIGVRRPDNYSLGRSGMVVFDRYDLAKRAIAAPPAKDAPADGVTYTFTLNSHNKQAALEYFTFPVTPGDYVLSGAAPGSALPVHGAYCFGAPTFHVAAGQIVYVGDFIPLWDAVTSDYGRIYGVAYANHPDDAAKFARTLPGAPGGLIQADIRNGASYPCRAQAMTGYIVPGKPFLPTIE